MNRKFIRGASFVILVFVMMTALCGCGKNNAAAAEKLTDEQALSAIKNYCFAMNPGLKDIAEGGEYPVYWEIASSDEQQTVVLFRSYTGALSRYYIDRAAGDTYVTEEVPGITDGEQRTDESFNIKDYLS